MPAADVVPGAWVPKPVVQQTWKESGYSSPRASAFIAPLRLRSSERRSSPSRKTFLSSSAPERVSLNKDLPPPPIAEHPAFRRRKSRYAPIALEPDTVESVLKELEDQQWASLEDTTCIRLDESAGPIPLPTAELRRDVPVDGPEVHWQEVDRHEVQVREVAVPPVVAQAGEIQCERETSVTDSLLNRLSQRPRRPPIIIPPYVQPHSSVCLPTPPTSKPGTPLPPPLPNSKLFTPPLQTGEFGTPPLLSTSPGTPGTIHPSTPPPYSLASFPISPLSMSRPATSAGRTDTLDSTASPPSPTQLYPGRFKPAAGTMLVDLNGSQSSLTHDFGHVRSPPVEQLASSGRPTEASPFSNGPAATPATTGQPQPVPGATNLSGLVCSTHRCTGKVPRALVGASSTVLGDKVYVFGGRRLSRRRPQLTADLYELDLIRRHWTKLETHGDVPPPRYFHSVCALGDTKLICYGGMSPAPASSPASQNHAPPPTTSVDQQPEVVVMSDIHIYDVHTRTWTFVPTDDTPQGRYAHCATILPSTAVFTSTYAPLSAIHHNPSSEHPHQGTIGVGLDGTGGAEMVLVGGQDSANHYIEQISVFNLRSLKWTATHRLGRSCGAYRSVVAPLHTMPASKIGAGSDFIEDTIDAARPKDASDYASSMLIYSNYNFLDVKLELQVRSADGSLTETPMRSQISPPGLRFPNGGVLNDHFVVSGTYLASSKQEYALWALDLRTLTWARLDAGGNSFSQGSWNRGVLWPRRNTFVILGNRQRNLVDDYNHRRINFSHLCLVELEAFGLYDNPRRTAPTSAYQSFSAPVLPLSIRPKRSSWTAGGRPHFAAAEELGQAAMGLRELADMDILSISGERIPVNSHVLSRRWGPYFIHLLREGGPSSPAQGNGADGASAEVATLRPPKAASRNSSLTITPSVSTSDSTATDMTSSGRVPADHPAAFYHPTSTNFPPGSRSRTLFLPHTPLTIQALLHYLYTSALPPPAHALSTPQILCSLLQLARPYHIDGLLEALVERIHQVMDGRNAAAVFNAAAMAVGGGPGTGFDQFGGGGAPDLDVLEGGAGGGSGGSSPPHAFGHGVVDDSALQGATHTSTLRGGLRIDTTFPPGGSGAGGGGGTARQRSRTGAVEDSDDGSSSRADGDGDSSQGSSATTDDGSLFLGVEGGRGGEEEVWGADWSCVVGLQKRGLRGLMEGRRARVRGKEREREREGGKDRGVGGEGVGGSGNGIVGLGLGLGIASV